MRRIVRLNSRCNAGPNMVESTHQHLSVANDRIQSSVKECAVLMDWSTASKQHWLYLFLWPEYSRQRQDERGERSSSSKRNDVGSKVKIGRKEEAG